MHTHAFMYILPQAQYMYISSQDPESKLRTIIWWGNKFEVITILLSGARSGGWRVEWRGG